MKDNNTINNINEINNINNNFIDNNINLDKDLKEIDIESEERTVSNKKLLDLLFEKNIQEEMHPTFLDDFKFSQAFDAEQNLLFF